MRTLISTPWWPSKTPCFEAYSRGIVRQLGEDTELFIATSFAESKFESIIRSMVAAEQYAMGNGFTHLFNVEADVELPPGCLRRLLSLEKPVVIALHSERPEKKSGEADFQTLVDGRVGWAVMLVDLDVLKRVPFESAFKGDFMTPDRLWFKRLLLERIPVWLDTVDRPMLLEKAESGPRRAFIGG